jgi:ribosome-associated protein
MEETGGVDAGWGVTIPAAELTYRATRAGGPGGQHVNTASTRVEVTWNIPASAALDEAQRARLLERLAPRLDGAGTLRVVASATRSQHRNRQEATARLARVVEAALRPPAKPRKRTRPSRAAREARLQAKRQRSEVKRLRGRVGRGE